MVNEQNLTPKTETIYELKEEYKVSSFEEFMKTYNESEKVSDSYQNEFESYDDVQVKGTYYGPGFWDDIKKVVKPVASGVLVVASVFPPTAAIAAPVAFGVIGTGATVMGIGHVTDNKELKEFGRDIAEIGASGREWQEATEHPSAPLNEYARAVNRK